MDTSGDLLVLDTIVDSTVVETIQKIDELGQAMCDTFFKKTAWLTAYGLFVTQLRYQIFDSFVPVSIKKNREIKSS